MKFHIAVLFVIGCRNMVYAQFDISGMLGQTFINVTTLISNGLNGYNPNLSADQVVKFSCAKPSDKVFNDVYFDDPDMEAKLDLTKPIGFIIHGWVNSAAALWVTEVSNTWVENYDMNVCRVDWSMYAWVDYAYAVQMNGNLTAHHLATFIRSLHDDYDFSYDDVILVGHSTGAQISGITGYILGGQIGRIFGLDPAAPLYTTPVMAPLEAQLDKSDAQYVAVIHSNRWVIGVGFSIGDADFYMNGGVTIQPGCTPIPTSTYDNEYDPISCSHYRAIRAFHLTLYNNPNCIALKCDTLSDYTFRTCSGITDSWGLNSNKIAGDFYFWVGAIPTCARKFWAF